VILTPHIAGASRTTIEVAANMMAAELTRFIGAEAAINPCQ